MFHVEQHVLLVNFDLHMFSVRRDNAYERIQDKSV